MGRNSGPIPDAPDSQLPADDGGDPGATRGNPDPGLRGPGHDWTACARAVLLGSLDRSARGLGRVAAGLTRSDATRARGVRDSWHYGRGHWRDRRARGWTRHDA